MSDLKDKIRAEMTADYGTALERCFQDAKLLFRLSDQGQVEVLYRDKITVEEAVMVYLIGKCYSKEAGYSGTEKVSNQELMDELGKPEGSILPTLMSLRKSNKVKQDKQSKPTTHQALLNAIEPTLSSIRKKLGV